MIRTICVCGAGTMGQGIAQVTAQHGFSTLLYDIDPALLEKAAATTRQSLDKLVQKGRLTQAQQQATLANLRFSHHPQDCIADLIIEAIVEKTAIKTSLFQQLAAINTTTTIFASNTSSLSITAIAAALPQPEQVIGMHFFNPAPLMKLVEVVSTQYTAPAVTASIVSLVQALGKTPVQCKDAPGFIVNHVARHFYLEALHLAEQGIADYATIDRLLESTGFKMGPFKLMDLIGNDINYAVSCSVYEAMGKPERLQPSPLQQEKVMTGALGRKSGKGYYDYGK